MAFIPDDSLKRRRELTPAAWFVYEEYCRTRNHKLGLSQASRQEISEGSGLAYRTVKNCLVELRSMGWINETEDGVILLVGDFSPVDKRHQTVTPKPSLNGDTRAPNKNALKSKEVSPNNDAPSLDNDTPSSNDDTQTRKVSSIRDDKRHQTMTPLTIPNKDTSKEEPEKEKPSRAKREGVILANREGLKINEYIGRLIAFRKSELNVKKLPTEGKEVAAAKWLFDEEWSVQQVKDCYHALKKHRWRDVDVDLRTIANQIAAWAKGTLNGGGNGSNRNSPEKKPSLSERAKQYNDFYGTGRSDPQARAG